MWHKGWQNKRSGWTRRVRWFELPQASFDDVRLEFVERMANNEGRETWKVTVSRVEAEEIWANYIEDDTLTGQDIFIDVMSQKEDD
jgi:uncharacterized protein (DUF1919 family)